MLGEKQQYIKMQSKRQQRRAEYMEQNQERIEKLIGKYGNSKGIERRIGYIEQRIADGTAGAREISELEVLHGQFKLLKEHERLKEGPHENQQGAGHAVEGKRTEEQEKRREKKESPFWDAELNPLGIEPDIMQGFHMKFRVGKNPRYCIPFTSNIQKKEGEEAEGFLDVYPEKEKPLFFRVKGGEPTVFSNNVNLFH